MAVVTAGLEEFTDEPGEPVTTISAVVDVYGPVAFDLMDTEPTTVRHDAPGSPATTLLVQALRAGGHAPGVSRRARRDLQPPAS